MEINPRDIFGSRLRKDWSYGDTFTSVIRKRIMRRIKTALDPDTYTVKNFKKMRQRAERYLSIFIERRRTSSSCCLCLCLLQALTQCWYCQRCKLYGSTLPCSILSSRILSPRNLVWSPKSSRGNKLRRRYLRKNEVKQIMISN